VPSRFFRLPLEEIAYVRAIVEGYDGLAYVHSPDARRGEVEWVIGEGMDAEAEALIGRLTRTCRLIEITRPDDWR
jgi:hypothetical protein